VFTLEQHSNIISKIGIRTFTVEKMDNLYLVLLTACKLGEKYP